MGEVLYEQGALDREVRRSQAEAAVRPRKTESAGGLRLQRRVPPKLFFNAVRGHGVDPADEEYWSDMERYVPSIKVDCSSTRTVFGPLDRYSGPRTLRCRHGRVKERLHYG
jgi:hypothetical protein